MSLPSIPRRLTEPLVDRELSLAQRYRNEWKYLISYPEADLLKRRLTNYLRLDEHTSRGRYKIRSLYFDDLWGSAFEEKMAGIESRQKWRVRVYNLSDDVIKLERKKKRGSYIHKDSASITKDELERVLRFDYAHLLEHESPLCREFYFELTSKLLRPKVMVDYEREPWVGREGDVRITFDYDVRAALGGWDLFDPTLPTLAALEPGKLVLEVKFTGFLPEGVRRLLTTNGLEFTALSKFTICCERAWHLSDPRSSVGKSGKEEQR